MLTALTLSDGVRSDLASSVDSCTPIGEVDGGDSNVPRCTMLQLLACRLRSLRRSSHRRCGGATPAGKTYQIAVIPKGTTHEFWRTIHAGAVRAERELKSQGVDVRIIWKGPIREDDREQQIQVVEGFLSQGVSGIVLAPLDGRALVRPVEEAKAAGIPVVIFDSGLDSKKMVCYVATDNVKGGQLAGEHMGSILGGKGKVLMLRYQEGSASTEAAREVASSRGSRRSFPASRSSRRISTPGPRVIRRSARLRTCSTAMRPDRRHLLRERVVGGRHAARAAGSRARRQGEVRRLRRAQVFLDAMKRGEMHGFVLQNPFEMGYLAVKTMVEHLQGQQVAPVIDTGVHVVTPENMDTPEMQKLLNPPVDEYLGK